jgi:hypothetical protein
MLNNQVKPILKILYIQVMQIWWSKYFSAPNFSSWCNKQLGYIWFKDGNISLYFWHFNHLLYVRYGIFEVCVIILAFCASYCQKHNGVLFLARQKKGLQWTIWDKVWFLAYYVASKKICMEKIIFFIYADNNFAPPLWQFFIFF